MQDLGGREPEVGGGRVGGRGLDSELDVRAWGFREGRRGKGWGLHECCRWRRGYGEAAGLCDVGDVDVEPLAG